MTDPAEAEPSRRRPGLVKRLVRLLTRPNGADGGVENRINAPEIGAAKGGQAVEEEVVERIGLVDAFGAHDAPGGLLFVLGQTNSIASFRLAETQDRAGPPPRIFPATFLESFGWLEQLYIQGKRVLWLLCAWIVVSGLDDLFVDAAALVRFLRRGRTPPAPEPDVPVRPLAIVVPCWQESAVIADMLRHNLAAIDYPDFDIFVGAYPNDPATIAAVESVAAKQPRVHLALCPHDGPTSKADCLNWVVQHVLLAEEQRGGRFAGLLMHDAEDVIHPGELHRVNQALDAHAMVQVPVLALPTPWTDWTHGVYCDEFAEGQLKELPARVFLGGFLPSCGVGTAIRRDMLDRLAAAGHNCIFEPACLTEDYELGRRIWALGGRQTILPAAIERGTLTATREFFPRRWPQAIRQRTRWVTGNALQSWQRHGWGASWHERYWFWRDRKGLLGNPLTLVANALFLLQLTALIPALPAIANFGFALQVQRTLVRMWFSARIYGWRFAALVPLRAFWANAINFSATCGAVFLFTRARLRGEPLRWLKTSHAYPSREALLVHKRRLGEILLELELLSPETLAWALSAKPAQERLGNFLVRHGHLSDEQRCMALALQQGIEVADVTPEAVGPRVARALPRHVVEDLRVIPVRIATGRLVLATAEIPDDRMQRRIQEQTRLPFEFSLISRERFEALEKALL